MATEFVPNPEAVRRITAHLLGEDMRNVKAAVESLANGWTVVTKAEAQAQLSEPRTAEEDDWQPSCRCDPPCVLQRMAACSKAELREWLIEVSEELDMYRADERERRPSAELVEALRLLRYLWQEADIETNVSVANKVRDLFSTDDPLAYDIERALAATDATALASPRQASQPGESRVQGWDRFWSRLEDRLDEGHGRPHYYECKVPDCNRDGHKCYRAGCTDPLHTHPSEVSR